MTLHRQPHLAELGQGEVVRDHGPCEHRRVGDVETQPGVGHRPPAADGLRLALGA